MSNLTDPKELRRDLTTVRAMVEALGSVFFRLGVISKEEMSALVDLAIANLCERDPALRELLTTPTIIVPDITH